MIKYSLQKEYLISVFLHLEKSTDTYLRLSRASQPTNLAQSLQEEHPGESVGEAVGLAEGRGPRTAGTNLIVGFPVGVLVGRE